MRLFYRLIMAADKIAVAMQWDLNDQIAELAKRSIMAGQKPSYNRVQMQSIHMFKS